MDGGPWLATVHGVAKNRTRLSDFIITITIYKIQDFPVGQMVKNLPAMQETWVQFLGWEDLLEKEMATHSSIFA